MEEETYNEWEHIIFTEKGIVIEKEEEEEEEINFVDIEEWIEHNIDDILDIYEYLKSSYDYYFKLKFINFTNFIENINMKEPEYDKPDESIEDPMIVGYWKHITKWYPFLGLDSYEEFKKFTVLYS